VNRRFIADRAVWALLVLVSAPSLRLFLRIDKRHEPMRVQLFRPEASVEGFEYALSVGFPEREKSSVTPLAHRSKSRENSEP
jgi:hypothetical protein